MITKKLLFPAVFAAVICCVGLLYLGSPRRNAFAQKVESGPYITRTAMTSPAETRKEDSLVFNKFISVASRNSQLQRSLSWNFAGKAQSGWQIYVPLISHTIGTNASADSPEFAAAIAKWQTANSLTANGLVDNETLAAFVKHWQGQRLGQSFVASDERLYSASIDEFYDPTRDAAMLQLEKETYAAYKRMLAAAAKDLGGSIRFTKLGELADGEKFLRIVSAYRSPAYQQALRRKEPNAGRGALAKFSAHSTGQALDLYVGGEPVTTKDHNRLLQVETPAYKWLVKNANRFGFYNYFYEPWHWEYVPRR